jgi:predicted nucleic acid-binding protein
MPVDRPPVPASSSDAHVATLFVHANVFLRLLTGDVPEQAEAADALLARAERGEVRLVTSVLVVAEVVWTLRSFYKRTKEQVRGVVLALCYTPGLEVEDADGIVQAAEWHLDLNVDFADAYHAAWMRSRGLTDVSTFNEKHMGRFEHLAVRVPGAGSDES